MGFCSKLYSRVLLLVLCVQHLQNIPKTRTLSYLYQIKSNSELHYRQKILSQQYYSPLEEILL